jgi:hypothetical protein
MFRGRHAEPEALKAEKGSAEALSVAAGSAPLFCREELIYGKHKNDIWPGAYGYEK